MFPLSVWTGYYPDLPIQTCIQLLKKAGFTHSELSFNHTEALLEQGPGDKIGTQLKHFLEEEGFCLPQGHLSFDGGLCDDACVDLIKRELELYLAIGIPNAVLHFGGGKDFSPEERRFRRMKALGSLQDFLKGTSLYLCLENLPSTPETYTAQKLQHIISEAGGNNLGICLDTGHLHLVSSRGDANQSQREFILTAGEQLRALHITENNGKNDVHQMPYSARYGIDWPQVVTSLKEIHYQGLFNLEILGERNAPDFIKEAKLRFIREMADYMLSN